MKKQLALLAVPFLLMAGVAKAEETTINNDEKVIITITATKTERAVEDVPTSMIVITSEEIEQKKATNVADLLRDVPGVTVVNSGGAGKSTSVFLRGSSTSHTLVMIDGVQVNSPTLGEFNLAELSTLNIDKIEILKGSQSSLYGSDAIGGVINITTKKGTDFNQSFVTVEAGSFNTQRTDASIMGANGKRRYSLGFSTIDTDGISTLKAPAGMHYEKDGYENTTMTGKFGYDFTDKTALDLMFYDTTSQNDLDDDFGGIDTKYYTSTNKTSIGSATFRQELNDVYNYSLKYSYVDSESINVDLTSAFSFSNSEIYTSIETVDMQNNFKLGDNIITLGGEYETQEGLNESLGVDGRILSKAAYFSGQIIANDNFNILLSGRHDDHAMFGSHSTYNAGLYFNVPSTGTSFKANRGTGFKAPTFNDLTFNPDLDPETSNTYDVTIEQKVGRIAKVSATYFNSQYKDLIEWAPVAPPIWLPSNVDDTESTGYEFGAVINLNDSLTLSGNYTMQEPIDKKTKLYLSRRSLKSGSASLSGDFGFVDFVVTGIYSGKRYDGWQNSTVLKKYTTVDATVNFNVDDNMTIFVRGTNLHDKEYVENAGYSTMGKAFYGGVKLTF